jgi:hypothetical protein
MFCEDTVKCSMCTLCKCGQQRVKIGGESGHQSPGVWSGWFGTLLVVDQWATEQEKNYDE